MMRVNRSLCCACFVVVENYFDFQEIFFCRGREFYPYIYYIIMYL